MSIAPKGGAVGRDWFAIVFSIALGIAAFLWFAPLSYGGQKTVQGIMEDRRLQLEADQELRILLQSPLFPGVIDPNRPAAEELTGLLDTMVRNKATFADLIDMMGYDAERRNWYMQILVDQMHTYVDVLGVLTRWRLEVSYSPSLSSEFEMYREALTGFCHADLCIVRQEPTGETVVGEVKYPSIRRGTAITVRMVRSKEVAIETPPEGTT